MSRTVRSPDGRDGVHERLRRTDVWVDPNPLTLSIVVPLLLIWLLERGLGILRSNIRAHTDGAPAETLTWRTTHRRWLGRIENRIAKEIETGRTESEPPGAVLIGI